MTGLSDLKDQNTIDTIEKCLRRLYSGRMYTVDQIEDVFLLTPERSERCTNIGTDEIYKDVLEFVTENIYWINVCLYVNEDFRNCFDDAIAIEKALTQVNDVEYTDFREDMMLDADSGVYRQSFAVDLTSYNENVANTIINRISRAEQAFRNSDMMSVYLELSASALQESELLASLQYIIYNLVYVVNAINRNGIFHKYVTLVVDSVKEKLA